MMLASLLYKDKIYVQILFHQATAISELDSKNFHAESISISKMTVIFLLAEVWWQYSIINTRLEFGHCSVSDRKSTKKLL